MSPAVRKLYYGIKPILPRSFRWFGRRLVARRILSRSRPIWPIDARAGQRPSDWPGWPDGREFGLVLTHDVEGQHGVDQVQALAEVEQDLGYRSSFNFIPEGEYSVPPALRSWLAERGFEVGVHDLHHEGHLFDSRESFARQARQINTYLDSWGAVGFRAGFMLHRLAWMHDLKIEYDLSTFDTDPFEPQPDAAGTAFPFFVPRDGAAPLGAKCRELSDNPVTSPLARTASQASDKAPRSGYVELPYTLPQDSTLFLLMRHASDALWREKLRWLVDHGAMALVNVHPDYIDFGNGRASKPSFPISIYRSFLSHVRDAYHGRYWHGTAGELARWYTASREAP